MQQPARVLPPRPVRGRPPIPHLRETILEAAERTFTGRDYHEVQMEDVATACGVAKGTLYRYFSSKRDLYLAVMFEGIERLRDDLEAALRTDDPPVQKIERLVRRTLAYFWDRRFFFALMHQHEHKPDTEVREWLRHREQLSRLVAETVEEAIRAGQVRAVNPRIAGEMLLGMIRGVNRYRARGDRLDALVSTTVDVFLRGVGRPAGLRLIRPRKPRRRT